MNKYNDHARQEALSFLRHELAEYKWYSNLLPVVAAVLQVALSVVLMVLPKLVLDAVQSGYNFYGFIKDMVWVGMLLVMLTAADMFFHNQISRVSQTFLYRRANALWEKKMLSMRFEAFASGEGKIKIEKARQHISSPNEGIVEFLGRETAVLEAVLGLAVYALIVGRLHSLMLLFLCILFVAELFIGLKIEKIKQSYKEEKAKADRRINYIAYGTKGMEEAKDIRIYSMIPMLREITETVIRQKCKVESDIQKWQLCHMIVTAVLIFIRDSMGYLFLILLFLNNEMSIGDFSMYFTAISGIGMWLSKVAHSFSDLKEAVGYVQDFYDFMKLPDDEPDAGDWKLEAPVSFEFQDVHYAYRSSGDKGGQTVPVIKGLSFKVEKGEKIAIVGANGAGKSTMIKLLCGMLHPDKGRILVNGTDIAQIPKRSYYALFAAVFQDSKALPVSIAENIRMGKAVSDDKKLWDVLKAVGLDAKVRSLPEKEQTPVVKKITGGTGLSGGQEQKLFLARAVYKDAPVLVLDEPTAALDPISENEIYLKYHALTSGKTAFFVSHRLASTRFCDRILLLQDGKAAEEGSHGELMDLGGIYADMFRVQSKYYAEETEAV